jgi:hypothetical protein
VAQAYNPSYLGSRDWEKFEASGGQKVLETSVAGCGGTHLSSQLGGQQQVEEGGQPRWDPISKITNKKKSWWIGSRASMSTWKAWDPKFNPQYCPHPKKSVRIFTGDWQCDSNDRALAYHVQGPGFNTQYQKKKKKNLEITKIANA